MGLSRDQIAEAASLLISAGRSGTRLSALPERIRPEAIEDAHAVHDAVREALRQDIGAIKVNLAGGVVFRGTLASAVCRPSPARFDAAPGQFAGIEAEIAFRFPDGLLPSPDSYDPARVAEATEACAAFDLVGTRFHDFMRRSQFERIADGLNAGAFAYGPFRRNWLGVNFAELAVQVSVDGIESFSGIGGHAASDPFLYALAYAETVRDQGIAPGTILTTGSLCGLLPVAPGQTIRARLGDFHPIEVTLRPIDNEGDALERTRPGRREYQ
ncbi:hypothetical protein EMQ25_02255 [Arsenicitalea aurantiaca]|uniref:Hydratase n=1 Tax=Arsenicitalea aurantiaca TaxID=1783274 RepID=A0A433XL47_9HYPH|nr:hypothetical protein [Arsenicitalea aurantiaca]RUT34802.1 hypothetical protein EMQ25_02255 [Arsenicitalea aurantiaca]